MKKITSPCFDFAFHIVSAATAIVLILVLKLEESALSNTVVAACLLGTSSIFCWQFYRNNRRAIVTNSWHSGGDSK